MLFLLGYFINSLLSFAVFQGKFKRAAFLERMRMVCKDWQSILMLLHGDCSRWGLFLMEGRLASSKLGIMIDTVLNLSLPLSGSFLEIVIIGKKLKEKPFLLCNQVVWKKKKIKSHLMAAKKNINYVKSRWIEEICFLQIIGETWVAFSLQTHWHL